MIAQRQDSISNTLAFKKLKEGVKTINNNGLFTAEQALFYVQGGELYRLLDACVANGLITIESRHPTVYRLVGSNVVIGNFSAPKETVIKIPNQELIQPVEPVELEVTEKPKNSTARIQDALKHFKKRGKPFTRQEFLDYADVTHGTLQRSCLRDEYTNLRNSFSPPDSDARLAKAIKVFKAKGKAFKIKDLLAYAEVSSDTFRRSKYRQDIYELERQLFVKDVELRLLTALNELIASGKFFSLKEWASKARTRTEFIGDYPRLLERCKEHNRNRPHSSKRRKQAKQELKNV